MFIVIFNNFIVWQLKVFGRTAWRIMYNGQTSCETTILGRCLEALTLEWLSDIVSLQSIEWLSDITSFQSIEWLSDTA